MKDKKYLLGAVAVTTVVILLITGICINLNKSNKGISISTPELARAMTYDQFEEGDEAVDQTENVKFSAFFLRDLDGDRYAEKIKGTCRPIGEEDTMYMEINVQTEGYLKDGKIEIAGQNFYLQTTLPRDEQLKGDYIGNDIKVIEFNQMNNGTQKLLSGIVRSGDYSYASTKNSAIGNNINNYSREDNKIILTGTYVGEDGTETAIRKEVPLTIDWYGTTKAAISNTYQSKYDLPNRIDEEKETIKLSFGVNTQETEQLLNISKNYVEGTIPELNGYKPTEVRMTNGTSENLSFEYNEETRTFKINRTATTNEEGEIITSVSKHNNYDIEVTYPLEAYQALGEDTVSIEIPVQTYYEGYNNPNAEFNNPYQSNTAKATITARFLNPIPETPGQVTTREPHFEVTVGKTIYNPYYRNIVSKQKPIRIYNGKSEKETDDTYIVRWYAYTGTNGETSGLVMKETKTGEAQVTDKFIKADRTEESMDNVTSNIGIYVTGAESLLKEDGWIKVYDEETDNLLVTFTKENWNKYTSTNPYKYELPVKHIRIETSETNKETSLYVYNIKELDDEYITTNYTKEEFDKLEYIKATLNGYLGGNYITTVTHEAKYEAPYSVATIGISNNKISTQVTEEHEIITIKAEYNASYNQVGWVDGSFLVKLPEEILETEINSVETNNSAVTITTYEVIEKENVKFIKINTQNNSDTEQSYTITIDTNITPDPRRGTSRGTIELYATNEETSEYYYKGQDIYDVNNNLNTEEIVNKATTSIDLVSPNSLLTNQTASEYDGTNSVVVSPQIADITPKYVKVDNEKQTAKIGVQIKNNYSSTIREVVILGKIPFEGNKAVLSGRDLQSEFTTKITNIGIEIPEELEGKVRVYYSENENPDKDLGKTENGWILAENVQDFSNIKTFLIDFEDEVIQEGAEYTFYYKVEIPEGVEFNKTSYSHHGVYFALDTEEGKYRTQTEPNKLGLRIAEKYNLEIIKTQKGKDKKVSGATYSIKEILEEGTIGKTNTGVTNENGTLIINNLYAEKTYEIQEIKSPNDYELNSDIIRFISHVLEDGTLTIEKIQGETKENIAVTKNEGEKHRVTVKVEDEAKAKLKIRKVEQVTENVIQGVKYKLTGEGLPSNGRILITNINGEINVNGLKINEEYTLEETKASGYYLASPIKFKVVNNEGIYEIEITEGTVLEQSVTEENSLPTANLTLENEKIPRYTLEISKIKKILETELTGTEIGENTTEEQEVSYLAGAKFRLYKDKEVVGTYITDENGKIIINDLYQYIEGRDEEGTYTLKEVIAPVGYAKVKDITFKVQNTDGELKLINTEGKEEKYEVEGTTVKVTIEDSPSFKLIKKDGETGEPLANVKFAIYNVNAGQVPATNSKGEIIGTLEIIDGKEYYTVTTDENGVITVDLPEGYYKALEVYAPEKYDIQKSTYYFGIGGSREGKIKLQASWSQTIVGNSNDSIQAVVETSDGGYIVGGKYTSRTIDLGNGITLTNNSSYTSYNDAMLIKYSEEGVVEWAKSIGGTYDDGINSVVETSDEGYIVGGYFSDKMIDLGNGITLTNSSYSSSTNDGMLIKYSKEGIVEWARTIGSNIDDYIHYAYDNINSINKTSDGGYIVGGAFSGKTIDLGNGVTLTNDSEGDYDGMIIKYSEEGIAQWAKSIGGSSDDTISAVHETSDGGYIVGGGFQSSTINLGNEVTLTNNSTTTTTTGTSAGKKYNDGMLIKLTETGEVEWAKSIGGTYADQINSVIEASDGGYIVGGIYQGNSIDLGNGWILTNDIDGYYEGMIIKYSENGITEWAKSIGDNNYYDDYVYSINKTSDGGFIVGGYFSGKKIDLGNEVTLYNGSMTIKYNSQGTAEWANSGIGGKFVFETSDENYMVASNIKLSKYEKIEVTESIVTQAKPFVGESNNEISSMAETNDGGYIVGGDFGWSTVDVGNGFTISNRGIIKYNVAGEAEWVKSIDVSIYEIAQTSDGGYIVGGSFGNTINLGNGVILTSDSTDGVLIKFTERGETEWAKTISGKEEGIEQVQIITSVKQTTDGGYIVGGCFRSRTIDLGNGIILINNSINGYDGNHTNGMLIKYSNIGEIEWAKVIGGTVHDDIVEVEETIDGGYIVSGNMHSKIINLGNGIILTNEKVTDDTHGGMLIKYNKKGIAQWAKTIGGSEYNSDSINSVKRTSEGGYIVAGYFGSSSINLGNGVTLSNKRENYRDGMLIKYNEEGVAEWAKSIGGTYSDEINSVIEASDGGYIVGGDFESEAIDLGNGITLNNNGDCEGMLIKYSKDGAAEWAKSIGGEEDEHITQVIQKQDESYLVAGTFESESINLGNGIVLTNDSYSDYAMTIKVLEQCGLPEVQELIVENGRKELNITTKVKEIDGVKGGSISGESDKIYETVKYGDNSIKEITITPDENYELIKITINGQENIFIVNEDGTYTMPNMENITEDKHIEVTFSLKENKILINKVDSETKDGLEGATFKIDQVEEREQPQNVIGSIVNNGQEYIEPDLTKEVTSAFGELTDNGIEYGATVDTTKEVTGIFGELINNGQMFTTINLAQEAEGVLGEIQNNGIYYFVEQDGNYVPTNSKTYNGSAGVSNSTANSYITIDLTNKTGKYAVVVNASVSSEENYDCGYATITESQTLPGYGSADGQFINISGTVSAQDYTSNTLEGGKTYYLHLCYKKDTSVDRNQDQIVFNSIKVYECESRTVTYNFIENEGKYESNNQGQAGTVANSYIPIDLTNKEGDFAVVVNANVSSYWEDYGYATITESTERPSYDSSTGRFIYISGLPESELEGDLETEDGQNYTSMILQGGKTYYLHFGYYKYQYSSHDGDDKFTINSVKVYEAEPITYEFIENEGKYESNNQGKTGTVANSYIPIDLTNVQGKYALVVNASISAHRDWKDDFGFAAITQTTVAPIFYWDYDYERFSSSTTCFINIGGVIEARDYPMQLLDGGKIYYLHLGFYNNIGGDPIEDKFTINSVKLYETKTVNYGFIENEGKYESTIQWKDSRIANSYIPIDLTKYDGKYNLIVNANITSHTGDYGYATVTEDTTRPAYDYATGRFIYISGTSENVATPTDYTTILDGGKLYYLHFGYYKNTSTSEGEDKFRINSVKLVTNGDHLYHTEVTTNSEGQAMGQIPFGRYAITEIVAPDGYELNDNSVVIEFRADGNHEFTIENNKLAKVIVHHYIKGTETKVAESDILQDKAGYPYTAIPKLDLEKYELEKAENGNYIIPDNATGQFVSGEQEVIYYYEEKQVQLVVNHYLEGTETPVSLINGEKAESAISYGNAGEEYTTEAISPEELSKEYELVEIPSNSKGRYEGNRVEVTYYYRKVVRKLIINKYEEDGVTPLKGAKFTILDKNKEAKTQTIEVEEMQKNGEYYFVRQENKFVSNNQECDRTTANSYVKIDLRDFHDVQITVNAEVSSEENYDWGYAIITETEEAPSYNSSTGKLMEISGEISAQDYTSKLEKGKIYYLHFGYGKDGGVNSGTDTFTINSIKIDGLDYTEYIGGKTITLIDEYITDSKGKTQTTLEAGDYIITEIEAPEGYQLPENPSQEITISKDVEEISLDVINEKQQGKVIVHHYIENSTVPVLLADGSKAQDQIKTGKIGDIYVTKAIDNVDTRFQLIAEPTNKQGIMTESEIVVNYYYRLKDTSVIVHYYKEGTTESLSQDITIEGQVDDKYTTTEALDIPSKYELVAEPENKEGIMTEEQIVVTYYYRLKETSVLVHHYLEGTEDSLSADVTINGQIDDEYTTEVANDILEVYELVEEPENKTGIMTEEQIIVIYYYVLKTDVEYKVEWYYQEEGKYPEQPNKSETRKADALEEVKVTEEDMIPAEGYELYVHDTEKEILEGEVQGNGSLALKIYFKPQYKVTYKPGDQGIFEEETHEGIDYGEKLPEFKGKVGEDGKPKGKEGWVFAGWKTEEGEQAGETVTKDEVYVAEWKKKEIEYTVEYYYDGEKDESKTEILKGEYEEVIEEYKEKAGEKYTLIKTQGLPLTITIDASNNIIKVYYGTKAKVKVEYIDKDTGEILEEIEEEGYVGKEYETTAKDFETYILVEEPEEKTIIMTEEEQVLRYYYERITSGVIEKHIDIYTEEIIENVKHEGKVGDKYKTKEKEIEGYDFVKERYPENAEGKITEEIITVEYYYSRRAKVTVKYINKETEEELAEEIIIEGHLGDEYETEEKEIEGYRIVKLEYPDNVKGEITKEEIEVIYYYERIPSGIITVEYVDKETEEIISKEEIKGLVGDEYKTEEKEIPYYMFINSTENTEGILTEEDYTVRYYYRKLRFNLSINKTITQINLKDREVKFDEPTKTAKVEIKQGELKETELIIVYNIEITNTGEIAGKAKVEELIPAGFELVESFEENAEIELQPGESKNIIVKLRWLKGEENLGIKENTAKLLDIENPAKYEEKTTEDNSSSAIVVISIKTGETIKTIIKVLLITSLMICLYMQVLLILGINKGPNIKDIKFLK